jgi:hypothetical protein
MIDYRKAIEDGHLVVRLPLSSIFLPASGCMIGQGLDILNIDKIIYKTRGDIMLLSGLVLKGGNPRNKVKRTKQEIDDYAYTSCC